MCEGEVTEHQCAKHIRAGSALSNSTVIYFWYKSLSLSVIIFYYCKLMYKFILILIDWILDLHLSNTCVIKQIQLQVKLSEQKVLLKILICFDHNIYFAFSIFIK